MSERAPVRCTYALGCNRALSRLHAAELALSSLVGHAQSHELRE